MKHRINIDREKLQEPILGRKLIDHIQLEPFNVGKFKFQDIEFLPADISYKINDIMREFINEVPQKIRCSPEDCCDFTVAAMVFGVFKGRDLYGAWNLFNIRKVGEVGREVLLVSSFFVSALPGIGTPQWDQEVTSILVELLNKPLPAQDGRTLKIVEWKVPNVVGTSNLLDGCNSVEVLGRIQKSKTRKQR